MDAQPLAGRTIAVAETREIEVFAAMLEIVQVTLPVVPTTGVVQDQPGGVATEANVVFSGVASVKLTVVAAADPLFVTV